MLKTKLGYDDSLDVFGVHGVGGIVGTILAGVFATKLINDVNKGQPVGLVDGNGGQVLTQLYGVVAVTIFCGVATWIILKIVDAMVGLGSPGTRRPRASTPPCMASGCSSDPRALVAARRR